MAYHKVVSGMCTGCGAIWMRGVHPDSFLTQECPGNKKSDDETPVPPHRRSTGSITSWGIVEAWLSAGIDNRIAHRMGVHGHEVGAGREDPTTFMCIYVWEPVRPNEDPSSAAVRAIGKL